MFIAVLFLVLSIKRKLSNYLYIKRLFIDFKGSLKETCAQRSLRVRKWSQDRKWSRTTNDPQIGPQMIPKLDRKWSRTGNDPHIGPQMIPIKK